MICTCTLCQQLYMDHKIRATMIEGMLKTTPHLASSNHLHGGGCCFGIGLLVVVACVLVVEESLWEMMKNFICHLLQSSKGVKMMLIYPIWPLLDILMDFGIPVYNGWLMTGIEQELGIAHWGNRRMMLLSFPKVILMMMLLFFSQMFRLFL